MRSLCTLILFLIAAIHGQSLHAQGEHARRAGAELRIILGDIRRLEDAALLSLQREGLFERIKGGLAPLDIILRLADQELQRPPSDYRQRLTRARVDLSHSRLPALESTLSELLDSFPLFVPTTLDVNRKIPDAIIELHQTLCAGCHDHPNLETTRPAYNLFDEAKSLSLEEFFSRMYVGVRGDRVTGIDNPLTDVQIHELVRYYRNVTAE